MLSKTTPTSKTLYLPLFCLVLMGFFLSYLGFQNRPVADDYCNLGQVRKLGSAWSFATDAYIHWTGRFMSAYNLGTILNNVSSINLNYLSTFLGALVCLVSYLIARILVVEKAIKLAPFICAGIWFTWKPFFGETIYWVTGGVVYLVPLTLTLAVVSLFFWITKLNYRKRGIAAALLFLASIAVGNSIELIPPMILTCGFLFYFWSDFFGLPNVDRRYYLLGFIGVLIGFLVLICAKGNFHRAAVNAKSFSISPSVIYEFALSMYGESFKTGYNFFILFLTFGVFTRLTTPRKYIVRRLLLTLLLWIAGLTPMLALNGFLGPRIFMFSTVVFAMMCFMLGQTIRSYVSLEINKNFIKLTYVFVLGITTIAFINDMSRHILLAKNYSEQLFARHSYILKNANKTTGITVKAIKGRRTEYLHFEDISTDPTNWINGCVAGYYKIPWIKVISE